MEENGQIVPVGRWILEEACRQLRVWNQRLPEPFKLSMSVNVSRRQLLEPDLLDDVSRILRESGVDGSDLKLEITENAVMHDPDTIIGVLRKLESLGVRIHMDDFGTGHSSLSCLHQFPLHMLKIDRAFINTMSLNREYSAVIMAIITLAHNLDMEVTAEGIERPEQIAQMIALDCDYAQGYLYSPPVPLEEAEALIFHNADLRNAG